MDDDIFESFISEDVASIEGLDFGQGPMPGTDNADVEAESAAEVKDTDAEVKDADSDSASIPAIKDATDEKQRKSQSASVEPQEAAEEEPSKSASPEKKIEEPDYTKVPISTLTSPVEDTLPLNTPELPQPTLFKVDKEANALQHRYVRSFPKNLDVKHPEIPKFTDPENKLAADEKDYRYTMFSPKGETKITANGHLLGGRKFLFPTFTLPGEGKKLYALANDAARALGLRDSFLLLSRSKHLTKIIAADKDRKFLVDSSLTISRTKSRAVNLVSCRGIFMCFGARSIVCGKRVTDDYWEEAAIAQGFTEKSHVFPVDKNYLNPTRHRKAPDTSASTKPVVSKNLYVLPVPSLEDRMEYLSNASTGQPTQSLPGQGISGGMELALMSPIPKYTNETTSQSKQNKVLMTLMDNGNGSSVATTASASLNTLPVSDELAGSRSSIGLPVYRTDIRKRVVREDSDKLHEIEYLHGTVGTNTLINESRAPRSRQWHFYWQSKAGVTIGLTKDDSEQFLKDKEDFLHQEETETRYNEYLNCDQVMTKKRRANPNFIGHSNITGHKPPYADKPIPPHQAGLMAASAAAAAGMMMGQQGQPMIPQQHPGHPMHQSPHQPIPQHGGYMQPSGTVPIHRPY
ncbi:CYFA0S13e00540g1_1 [Cyberlindnera fabianii]|uniref:CYFA0S13e00540g1_1 n=1 Tax=Cyberlindnera fabianii TaxID=36022 RepID=A0A061B7Q3_CYBFA|nr:CYFA0S13e00540g1_1 [Cyberlindnera fabianii]